MALQHAADIRYSIFPAVVRTLVQKSECCHCLFLFYFSRSMAYPGSFTFRSVFSIFMMKKLRRHDQGLVRGQNMMLVLIQSVYIHRALLNARGFRKKISLSALSSILTTLKEVQEDLKSTNARVTSLETCWRENCPPKLSVASDTLYVLPYSNEDLMSNQEGSVTAFRFNSGL